jgi:hypothetical protein
VLRSFHLTDAQPPRRERTSRIMMDSDRQELEQKLMQLLEELRELLAVWANAPSSQERSSLVSFYAARRARLS